MTFCSLNINSYISRVKGVELLTIKNIYRIREGSSTIADSNAVFLYIELWKQQKK